MMISKLRDQASRTKSVGWLKSTTPLFRQIVDGSPLNVALVGGLKRRLSCMERHIGKGKREQCR